MRNQRLCAALAVLAVSVPVLADGAGTAWWERPRDEFTNFLVQPPADPETTPPGNKLTLDQDTQPGVQTPERKPFVHNRDSDPRRPPVILQLDGRYEHTSRTDAGIDPNGSLAITRSGLSGNLIFGPEHPVQISIPVDYETSTYSFRHADGLVPGGADRVRSVEQWVVAPNIELKITDEWGVFGGGLMISAGQYGADFGKETTFGGFGGAVWKPSKQFTLRLGVGVREQLEDKVQVAPAFWMEWRIGERTRLTSQGYNIRYEYDINEAWTIKADCAFETRAYRLDADGAAPNGVFRDDNIPITARIEFVPHPAARFEAWIGTNVYRKIQFDLNKDERFSRDHLSPSLMYGISFEFIF